MVKGLLELKSYIEKNNYKGYDPYDALKSPLFQRPFFKTNKIIRFGTQQLVKRLPFNSRPLLFIPKGYNPVTLGLCIQAYAYLYKAEPKYTENYLKRIEFLVNELKQLIPKGFSGACWGYDFDWEARYAKIPEYQPTVVATGIITNALFIAYKLTGIKEIEEIITDSAKFVTNDLNRTIDELDGSICFSYSPFDKQQVFNASIKGARLLSQTYSINRNNDLRVLAKRAVEFVVKNQKKDGSWGYSLASTGDWTDNYHTGYVLDCLDEYQTLTGDTEYAENLVKGYAYYKSNFITEVGEPKFYDKKKHPIDCTSAAQTILTTLRFGDIESAQKVASWMVNNMQKKNGSFKFRKFKYHTINTSFMRWSDSWMFAALTMLLSNE